VIVRRPGGGGGRPPPENRRNGFTRWVPRWTDGDGPRVPPVGFRPARRRPVVPSRCGRMGHGWAVGVLGAVLLGVLLGLPAAPPPTPVPRASSPIASLPPSLAGFPLGSPDAYQIVNYESSVDQTRLSYLEWLPAQFNSSRTYPLAVFLHGLGYDASELLLLSGGLEAIQNASANGFLLISIQTRTPAGAYVNSPYTGPQEQDVLDAVAHEETIRHVNASAVYLFGSSMGTIGAYSIAGHHPGLIRGIGAIAECPESFMGGYYHYLIGVGGSILSTTDGLLPNQSAQALGLFYYMDATRYFPQNLSHVLLYAAQGGDDDRCPNNPHLFGYQQSNNTFLNSTCLIVANWSQPANCQTPFSRLSQEVPGSYLWRYVYEPTGDHSLNDLNSADMFAFWTGAVPTGLYCASEGGVPTDCPGPPTVQAPFASPATVDSYTRLALSVAPYGGATPYSFDWQGLPPGCDSVNASVVSCVPTASGTYSVSVRVTDANGSAVDSSSSPVTVNPPFEVVASSTAQSGPPPLRVTFSATATGGTSPTTVAWAFGDGATSTGWQPSHVYVQSGVFTARLWVNDSGGGRFEENFSIATVAMPLAVPTPLPSVGSADVGQVVTFSVLPAGGSGAYWYRWTGLPSPCTSQNLSAIACVPQQPGVASVQVNVTDGAGGTAVSPPLAFSVYASPAVTGLAISRTPVDVGQSLSLNVTWSGGAAPYTVAWAGVPPGCPYPAAGTVACAPTTPGEYLVHANITDANGVVAASPWLTLWVHAVPIVAQLRAEPNPGVDGEPWTLTAVGGNGSPPYTYAFIGLPPGCAGTNQSVVRCTPSTTGLFTVRVTLTDSVGVAATRTILLEIDAAPTGPDQTLPPGVAGTTLPWWVVGALAVVGGAAGAVVWVRRRRPSSPEWGDGSSPPEEPEDGSA
jgi:PKD repeat protein